jgi:ERCC4-type nuclease
MIIKIDYRERDLINVCKYYLEISPLYKNIQIVTENLPIGDIVIYDDKLQERIVIERKSIRDLSASIKDGRYEEQSYRLNGLHHENHNIIYLIEGDLNGKNSFKDRIDKITLYSAMFSLNHYKGFSVLRTFTQDETSLVICNMAYKMHKCDLENKKAYYQTTNLVTNRNETNENEDTEENTILSNLEKSESTLSLIDDSVEEETTIQVSNKDYCSVVKKVKKENITPDNIGEIMLCQIPGISSTTAIAILKEFKTLPQLLEKIKEDGGECLSNITYVNTKNQTRKINKTVVQNIKKFLLC